MVKKKKITLGVSCGDINGIGIEVFVKAFSKKSLLNICVPILYAPKKILDFYKTLKDTKDVNYNVIKSIDEACDMQVNLIDIYNQDFHIQLGTSTHSAGQIALNSFNTSIQALKEKKIDALVTLPINKKNVSFSEKNFTGHTEHLENKINANSSLMLLVSKTLKIATATNHIPISKVSSTLNSDLLNQKINILIQSLTVDFLIPSPKIALLGLNPHAGDDGLIGYEDKEIIVPVVNDFYSRGHSVFGPYPADGFFGSKKYTNFDAVLGMYHDQSLVPFKHISFGGGVNYTAGPNVIRTSPDHGVGYDIAGKGLANEKSFIESIYLAIKIHTNRKSYLV
jgi:4-hydroxythreonine-4-phosphate dehydrogenase